MNFTEAVEEVKVTVKRPDLISRIRREVNSAITFYCLENDFPRDYSEQVIALNAQEYTQAFALSSMTRFRKFKYLRRAEKKFLTVVADSEMFAGCYLEDKYYIAGSNVNISMAAKSATLDVGYYSYPPVLSDGSPTFWMLDLNPYMIIDRACAAVFKVIGDEKSLQAHAASARESYLAFRKDQLSSL